MAEVEVLIAGAGPTGLVLATWLHRLGIRIRIIDKAPAPGRTSRAIAMHARSLEFYAQLGLADRIVKSGIEIDALRLHVGGRMVARFDLGRIGTGLSPFPFVLALAQDEHERVLIKHLEQTGITVERNVELIYFKERNGGISATLRKGEKMETCEALYVCGCDGASSTVRRLIGANFPGGTYQQMFFVADVKVSGPRPLGAFGVHVAKDGFCIVMPVRTTGTIRLIGIVPPATQNKATITYDDVADFVARATRLRVEEVNWFSTYHVHHRVADTFRHGRAFLLGDAGHIHSPAGGQGMNTGIGDAVNLAWKLGSVLRRQAAPEILESYEIERIAFARWLVQWTDQLFKIIASRSPYLTVLRGAFFLSVAPLVLRFRAARRALFRRLSQIEIEYHKSPLSSGEAGRCRAGDRLPWVSTGKSDNFAPLRALDWQIHVYGDVDPRVRELARTYGLPLHRFDWSQVAEEAGLSRGGLYLVRPDGYLAMVDRHQSTAALRAYIEAWQIIPRPTNA
jgi:2-polyprenyl-6-methoxyphenol hydroxylase-like FAD-dependent oxidoreductase